MTSGVVDLRSDTLTQPTDEMREAMRSARVGDDVYGEDPTVNELQEAAAKRLGKEAALLVPTGTMGNEVAIYVHARREGEIIVEEQSHIVLYEQGGAATLSGVQVRPLRGERGVFTPAQVLGAMRDASDPHEPPTRLVSIENTHNLAGGTVWTVAQTEAVAKVCQEREVPLHVDGARIFNSAIAQDVPAPRLVRRADSVMFCLSKGLSAPVGSLLVGDRAFIERAWRVRKLFGGGMRQAGHLAAAGLVALETMVDRLAEDHANARRLASGLAKVEGLRVDPERVHTNIVLVDTSTAGRAAAEIVERVGRAGVRCLALGPDRIRLVTHRGVDRPGVETAIAAFASALERPTARTGRAAARAR